MLRISSYLNNQNLEQEIPTLRRTKKFGEPSPKGPNHKMVHVQMQNISQLIIFQTIQVQFQAGT